jgi:hypothetical protein
MTLIPTQGLTMMHCWERKANRALTRRSYVVIGYAVVPGSGELKLEPVGVGGRIYVQGLSRYSVTYEHHLAGRISYTDADGEVIDIAFAETKAAELLGAERP